MAHPPVPARPALSADERPAHPCKCCERERFMTSTADRARYDAQIFEALALWLRTPVHERSVDPDVCRQLARASVYAEYLVAADCGLCRQCSEAVSNHATDQLHGGNQ